MDHHVNKVYINPNFKKTITNQNIARLQSPIMHVNPAFSQKCNTYLQGSTNDPLKLKIFVNPYFIRPTGYNELARKSGSVAISPIPAAVSTVQPTIQKSRYTLVRREHKINDNMNVSEKPKHTVIISKYKSITMKALKKSLESAPVSCPNNQTENFGNHNTLSRKYKLSQQSTSQVTQIINKAKEVSPKQYTYKYKFIKHNSLNHMTNRRMLITNSNKFNILTRSNYRSSKLIGKLKKNNVPCPLFRKYGNCLRKDHGTCEFLHDKRHISLCRKFIKGLCYDEDCLLSHDISSNKMPTCYFYLKGVCSREDCPYLHVKVNENAIICSDFLKGYCEKGSSCSKRHDNDSTQRQIKHKDKSSPHRLKNKKAISEVKSKKIIKNYHTMTIKELKHRPLSKIMPKEKEQNKVKERRYYKETLGVSDICEIKPSRCKIGLLPSFIQL